MSIFTVSTGAARLDQSNVAACVIYIFVGLILISTCGHILYYDVILKLSTHNNLTTNHPAENSGKVGNPRSQTSVGQADRKRNNVFSWQERQLGLATIKPHRVQRERHGSGAGAGDDSGQIQGQAGIMKNKFRPILPSQHKKKENVRLRFGQPMVVRLDSKW